MSQPGELGRRISDLMGCLARYPEWKMFSESLGRLWFMVGSLITENNALRRRNERLTDRIAYLEAKVRMAQQDVQAANSANSTAQTMAAHWRFQVMGGDYDATKESP